MEKKREGQVGIITSIFLIMFLIVMLGAGLQVCLYQSVKIHTEDALAASNLASAVIDIQEYGITHNLIIADPEYSYSLYQEALRLNLGLDEHGFSENKAAISGQVEVLDYIIYNVKGSDIEIYCFGQSTYSQVIAGGLGSVTAPNGQLIESTSVYSRITFPVDGILGIHTIAVKDKLADIVKDS